MERVKFLIDQIKSVIPSLDELANVSDEIRDQIQKQIADYALSIRTTKLKPEELEEFFKKPYLIQPIPGKEQSWYLIAPKFMDIQLGWLSNETSSYRVFLINRYVEWIGGLPEEIKRQLGFKPAPDLKLDGESLSGGPRALDEAWRKYRPFLKSKDEKEILINKRRSFELIAALIKDGILPFTPKPVNPEDIVDRKLDFELRDYQKEAWKVFQKYSNVGIFYPASTGKTIIGLYLMTHIKPPHLVVVPTRLLQEQWTERIQAHTDLKPEEYVVATYQMAVKRYGNQEWSSLIIDETHHLPADQFSKLSFIKRKYTCGLSATPQREDGREEYIFSLTGMPVGLGWDHFRQLGIIKSPTCHVWIVKNFEAKLNQLKLLLDPDKKTLIFSDSIEIGKTIAKRFDLPHVYGATKQRLSVIQDTNEAAVVVSRVADEGVSLPDVERVIEVNWLFGSRRQEVQRFTRLLHGTGKGEGEHHILMTLDEYVHDRKRLFSIMDKGFKVEIHREGITEKAFTGVSSAPRTRAPVLRSAPTVTHAPVISSPESLTGLPGMQKLYSTLSEPQQRLIAHLSLRDGEWHSTGKLWPFLGYATYQGMINSMNLPELLRRHLIERKPGMIRTNFKGLKE